MPKVKVCPRIVLPSPDPSIPPPPPLICSSTMMIKSVPSAPPPPLIPSSIVTLKSVPSTTPSIPFSTVIKKIAPSAPPPSKKLCSSPFIKGQVGCKFFSLAQPKSYMKIPDGHSLIIAGFRKPLPHENVNVKHILLDPFRGVWTCPRVFEVWCKEIESGALSSDESSTHCIALVRNGAEFFLAFSDRKTQINNVMHQIQQDPKSDDEAFPNTDSEDESNNHDPDFFPDDED